MENNDRQQDGANFGEVREYAGPWEGGFLSWAPEYADQAGTEIGDSEIQMPPDYVGKPPDSDEQASAARGGETIEMPPDYVGQAGAPDAAAAPADAGDALYRKENDEENIIQEETQNQKIDAQGVQREAAVQNEAQEYQGIDTQEQS